MIFRIIEKTQLGEENQYTNMLKSVETMRVFDIVVDRTMHAALLLIYLYKIKYLRKLQVLKNKSRPIWL
jgi:hypothetical protein